MRVIKGPTKPKMPETGVLVGAGGNIGNTGKAMSVLAGPSRKIRLSEKIACE